MNVRVLTFLITEEFSRLMCHLDFKIQISSDQLLTVKNLFPSVLTQR